MAASNFAARIVAAARLVGPTAPKSVPWRLVSGGVYDAVLDAGDVPHPSLTPEFVAKTDARMAEYGPVGPAAVDRIAIAAYLGNGDTFDRAIADFATAYADQNERDYQALVDAVGSGRIIAETGL